MAAIGFFLQKNCYCLRTKFEQNRLTGSELLRL